jgi:hypothetical protein
MSKSHKIAGLFFNYGAPWIVGVGAFVLFVILSLPEDVEKRKAKIAAEGEGVYCLRVIETDKKNDKNETEYRCYKGE